MTRRWHHLRAQARLAWHVFRGRPLAYRFTLTPGSGPQGDDGLISHCVLKGTVDPPPDDLGERIVREIKRAQKDGRLPTSAFRDDFPFGPWNP